MLLLLNRAPPVTVIALTILVLAALSVKLLMTLPVSEAYTLALAIVLPLPTSTFSFSAAVSCTVSWAPTELPSPMRMLAVTPICKPSRAPIGTLLKSCPAREVVIVWLIEVVVV